MTKTTPSVDFLKKLCASVGEDASLVRRIVIDASVDNAMFIYVEKYGDDKLLLIEFPTPDGISIKKVAVADNDGVLH